MSSSKMTIKTQYFLHPPRNGQAETIIASHLAWRKPCYKGEEDWSTRELKINGRIANLHSQSCASAARLPIVPARTGKAPPSSTHGEQAGSG